MSEVSSTRDIACRRDRGGWATAGIALVASMAMAFSVAGCSSAERPPGLSATGGGLTPSRPVTPPAASPATPPGKTVVNVSLTDSGGPKGRGSGGYSTTAMQIHADRTTVPHGPVTFRVTNAGVIEHEMLILPLADSQPIGARPFGPDARVDETGKLAKPSHSEPKIVRSLTVTLAPGRYELICNHPGHYVSGMYTQLTVT